MSKEYTEHKTIAADDFKLVDATMTDGNDLIWVSVGEGGAWFSPDATDELAASLLQITEEHRARIAAVEVPNLVTEALCGRDMMLTSLAVLERLRDAHQGPVGNYIGGVIYARLSLRAAGIEIAN
jgi:hypothetical protein